MTIQQRFNVLLQLQFYNIFTNALSKILTDILKIYELPKIYNKKPKYCLTLVLTIIRGVVRGGQKGLKPPLKY